MSKVTLINYDIGNILSVERALHHIGADYNHAKTAEEIDAADKLILPGVGAFASCVNEIEKRGLTDAIKRAYEAGKPMLGICVGMQMLFEESEEFGTTKGLGFIEGSVKAIPNVNTSGAELKIPHIGWSALNNPAEAANDAFISSPLLKDIPKGAEVYFVHSFTAYPKDEDSRLVDSQYGGHTISAMVNKGNLYGAQFHPEKSGPLGLKILENFIQL